jgi:tetratricopeptide (TPR) repeat protein
MAVAAPPSNRWLFGPVPDLLLGCGLFYVAAFVAFAVGGRGLVAGMPSYLLPLLVILVSMPHYGGTLLRVYEFRESRRAYAIFSLWASALVFVWFVAGIYDAYLGAVMLTLYITWSPWHYSGQNYGLAMMFLYRRGVDVSPLLKRWIYASFVLSYALAFLTMHSGDYGAGYGDLEYTASVRFLALGIPSSVGTYISPMVGAGYLLCLGVMVTMLLRRGAIRDLLPTLALVLTQALWFSVPMAVNYWRIETGLDPLDGYFRGQDYILVIALAHAAQYLWVTTYYAQASQTWHGYSGYLAKVLLAGVAIWTLPVILFAPDAMGQVSYRGGLSLLLAAAVNIHHFILDGAIWKLRSGRIANILVRSGADDAAAPARERPWLRPLIWAGCAGCVGAALFAWYQEEFAVGAKVRSGDLESASASMNRLAWIGRDNSSPRHFLAQAYEERGQTQQAIAEYQRVIDLSPENSATYLQIGTLQAGSGDWDAAGQAFGDGLAIAPLDPGLLGGATRAALELGRTDDAAELLVRSLESPNGDTDLQLVALANNTAWNLATASEVSEGAGAGSIRIAEALVESFRERPDPNIFDTLGAAYASAGRFDDAVIAASRAVELTVERGEDARTAVIGARLALYRQGRRYVDPSG